MNPLIQSKNTTILPVLIALTLGCFALSPKARAQCQGGCLGDQNTVLGAGALIHNTTGFGDTAMGFNALFSNTTGLNNTAIGFDALLSNTTGLFNTATGAGALLSNTIGNMNTANGEDALYFNTTGNDNTANGNFALTSNTTGNDNTANGNNALSRNRTGNNNIALGASAGQNLTTGNHNIYIGNLGGSFDESRRIRIGTVGGQNATFIAGISGTAVVGDTVVVDANGQLGTATSSARFKKEIRPMNNASESILALKPTTFQYKSDTKGTPRFGLIAEEVAKVNPDLVVRDRAGEIYSVRYDAVNAMLLNEFLKEHRKVENLKNDFQTTVAQQQKEIAALTATVKEQAAQIQKVSASFEAGIRAQQTMVSNP